MSLQTSANPLPELPLGAPEVQSLRAAVAGLSASQLYWASGYLAGLAAGTEPAPAAAPDETPKLTILYGTQTGNGRRIAEALAQDAAARGLAATPVSMAD
jgi:sulfite reductase (NADPH) flavoprotein alpha-component